jgi:hypothetical protein
MGQLEGSQQRITVDCLPLCQCWADTIQMQGSGVAELGISGFPGPWIHAVSCLCFSDRTYNGRGRNNTSPRPRPLPRTWSIIRDSQEGSSLKIHHPQEKGPKRGLPQPRIRSTNAPPLVPASPTGTNNHAIESTQITRSPRTQLQPRGTTS